MSQVVATTTNILQSVTSGPGTVPGGSTKLLEKQWDNGRRSVFDQHLAGQLGQSGTARHPADTAADGDNDATDGKLLPGHGNISPLPFQSPARTPAVANKTDLNGLVMRDSATALADDSQATPQYGPGALMNHDPSGQDVLQVRSESNQILSATTHPNQSASNPAVSSRMFAYQGQGDAQLAVNNLHLSDRQNTQPQLLTAGDLDNDSMTQLSQGDLKRLFSADYATESSRNFRLYSQSGHMPSLNGQASLEHRLLSRMSESRSRISTDLTESVDKNTTALPQTLQSSDGRPVPAFQLNQPVTNPQWTNEFSDRVRWLVSGNIKKAELSLTPKHLGTIDISITVHNDQTHISFNTQNHHSRDLVEASLGRLREMFDQAGLGNVNVDVSQHSDHRETASQGRFNEHHQNQSRSDDELVSTISENRADRQPSTTLIDTYA